LPIRRWNVGPVDIRPFFAKKSDKVGKTTTVREVSDQSLRFGGLSFARQLIPVKCHIGGNDLELLQVKVLNHPASEFSKIFRALKGHTGIHPLAAIDDLIDSTVLSNKEPHPMGEAVSRIKLSPPTEQLHGLATGRVIIASPAI
jgi:hypothetical protein